MSTNKWIKIIIKSLLTIILIISFTAMSALNTFAHSGRTDSSGGHRDNKNASGLGSYHYHHGYGPHLHPNGICPYAPKQEIPTPPKIAIDSVKIASNNTINTTLIVGENRPLIVTISPENATNKSITWSSNDTNIATVSNDGIVNAKNAGTVIITAKTNNGKTDNLSLTIDKAVENISINEKDITLVVGENRTLSATISPEDATNKSITWSSSDTNIATVSDTGVITANNDGATTITSRAYNGKTSSITINVNKKEEPVSVSSSRIEDKKTKDQNVETVVGLGLIASVIAGVVNYKRNKK